MGLSLFTALMWGVAPIALKVMLEAMDAYTISWYRFLISAALLLVFVLYRHGRPTLSGLRGMAAWLLAVAVIGLCGNYVLFMLGLDHLTPSTASVVVQTSPMFLLAGGVVVFKERFSRRQFLGLAMLIIGLMLFFDQRLHELFAGLGQYTIGIVLITGAALSWSIYALAQKQLLNTLPSDTIMLLIYIGCALAFLPLSHPAQVRGLDAARTGLLVFCGLNTILAYGAFAEALDHLEASRVGAIIATSPLITIAAMKMVDTIFPGFLAPERLNAWSLVGAALVVAGSMVSSMSRKT
jgi:drug/metabolite transporter (DMT)-like permease